MKFESIFKPIFVPLPHLITFAKNEKVAFMTT